MNFSCCIMFMIELGRGYQDRTGDLTPPRRARYHCAKPRWNDFTINELIYKRVWGGDLVRGRVLSSEDMDEGARDRNQVGGFGTFWRSSGGESGDGSGRISPNRKWRR